MDDLIPHDFSPEKVGVTNINVTYCQEGDTCDNNVQNLEVWTDDGGGGPFFIIKTERWAFDNIDDLINVLNDFKKRINIKEE